MASILDRGTEMEQRTVEERLSDLEGRIAE
jgi:hypothetical protein